MGQNIFFNTLILLSIRGQIALKLIIEMVSRLACLVNIGLDYLTLASTTNFLSSGEVQRIRLASLIRAIRGRI